MKPLIGISVTPVPDPDHEKTGGKLTLNQNFAEMVARAGGVPLLIPPMADAATLAEVLDGWLIPGGDDIDATHFGEENHPKAVHIDSSRFDSEQALFKAANAEMPILGICYGCQFLNVQQGGSLIQHLPDVEGSDVHTGGPMQHYGLDVNSRLSEMLQTAGVEGKSYHHQGVGRVGEGLKVVARHADGTVEALESTDRPWLFGVQWHPERTPDDAATIRLFEAFIQAAQDYAQRRGASR